MNLTDDQIDRAGGVLLGQALGDALGVPYASGAAPYDPATGPQPAGGGPGDHAPGEWSGDTQMALCVAEVAATGTDLTSPTGQLGVATAFLSWFESDPPEVGAHTRAVLTAVARRGDDATLDEALLQESWAEHERTGRSAGNSALARTCVVGLAALADREATARSARAVARLTHWDTLAGDSCVLWSEAVRRAVVDGVLDLRGGLDLLGGPEVQVRWSAWVEEAEREDPSTFSGNGCTVVALQAAWSAVHRTRGAATAEQHVVEALSTAVGIGGDTGTVAAIAGGLLGARYGSSGLPERWAPRVHGWPGLWSDDLVRLAVLTAHGG
ncbi:ADP-ribosylglycohydrolase family protein [Ornithinimicrobium avium]|uniref:ADP-ribosylglycohydrolase family protein n=1 Tax=Ornithinimicrobium avium TaxID=2283195 RepID=A0A345NQ92_9MICO|nr:ADP-ribosylglycohydrolase family protein [Ornithinimicrobium avium]AXH97200.1 ADP-ribosylglycohydrolase family protein [Ornithinimicrobium avium]